MGLIWGGGGCCCRSFYYCINICYYCYRLTKEGLGISFPQPNARKKQHWFLKAELLASLTRREVISSCVWGSLEEIQLIEQQKWCGSKMVEVAARGIEGSNSNTKWGRDLELWEMESHGLSWHKAPRLELSDMRRRSDTRPEASAKFPPTTKKKGEEPLIL